MLKARLPRRNRISTGLYTRDFFSKTMLEKKKTKRGLAQKHELFRNNPSAGAKRAVVGKDRVFVLKSCELCSRAQVLLQTIARRNFSHDRFFPKMLSIVKQTIKICYVFCRPERGY